MHLLTLIEHHLTTTGVRPTRFGRDAVGDPRFVLDLRRGREPGRATEARVRAYMGRHRRTR